MSSLSVRETAVMPLSVLSGSKELVRPSSIVSVCGLAPSVGASVGFFSVQQFAWFNITCEGASSSFLNMPLVKTSGARVSSEHL